MYPNNPSLLAAPGLRTAQAVVMIPKFMKYPVYSCLNHASDITYGALRAQG